ncbi:MAG: AAA family ATPase [Blastocatellia bacterium]
MLQSISIKDFRLFQDLKIDSLNRVNLITGRNNSGKTALLEALYLLFGNYNNLVGFPSALRSSFIRDPYGSSGPLFFDEFDSFWIWLFPQKNVTSGMKIEATADNRTSYSVILDEEKLSNSSTEIRFIHHKDNAGLASFTITKGSGGTGGSRPDEKSWPKLSIFSTSLSSPTEDADQFNRIAAKRGGEERVIKSLRVIEPRLQDLKYLKLGNQPLVYADIGMEDLIPTTQLGQGFTRLLRLFSEILATKSKIVLIDEIENGIYYSTMPEVWRGIAAIARQEDLQIFATTHSYECIRSAHEAFSSESHYDLALHRLDRVGDDIKIVTYDETTLETSFEMNLEVR